MRFTIYLTFVFILSNLASIGCVALSSTTLTTSLGSEVTATRMQVQRLDEDRSLQLLDVRFTTSSPREIVGTLSARLVRASTCRDRYFETTRSLVKSEIVTPGGTTSHAYAPVVISGEIFFGVLASWAAMSCLVGDGAGAGTSSNCGPSQIPSADPKANSQARVEQQSLGVSLAAAGGTLLVMGLVDIIYTVVQSSDHRTVDESEHVVRTSKEACRDDMSPVPNQVGSMLIGGVLRYFKTDHRGRLEIEDMLNPGSGANKGYIDLGEETAWVDLATR